MLFIYAKLLRLLLLCSDDKSCDKEDYNELLLGR